VRTPRKGAFLVIGAFLGIAGLAAEFQAYFWTWNFARSQALRRVVDDCLRSGRDPRLLTPGTEGTLGIWSFEWTYEGSPRYLYGTWIARDGYVELYTGDPGDPQSAAYNRSLKHPKSSRAR
jgi:hypothetical protein